MNPLKTIAVFTLAVLAALAAAQSSGGDLRVTGKFISNVPTGEPPLEVSSTTNISNLNADKLDGFDVGDFALEGSGVGVHYKNLVGLPGREIDQDCATGAGCFAGDTGDFPVTITQPGSYRLASNLETSDEDQTIISIQTSNVVLDLKGFSILGPTSCSGDPLSCSPTGIGRGIDSGFSDITVRNGVVSGMGALGVNLRFGARVENVHARNNGANGIHVSDESRLANNITRMNRQHGLIALAGSVVTDNVSVGNGTHGLMLTSARAFGNTASGNGDRGISCGGKCLIRENQADGNGDVGIRAPDASVIIGNMVSGNAGDGIVNTLAPGTVLDNTVSGNGGTGLNLRSNSGYARNVITDNATTVSGGAEVGQNVCDTNTTCP